MINRQIFAKQVLHLLETDTYLRVSDVSSKLMVSKPTARRLLNEMCNWFVLKKELKPLSGNANIYLYSKFWRGFCFVAPEVNLSNRLTTLILKPHDNESTTNSCNRQISRHTLASCKSRRRLPGMLLQASEIMPRPDCRGVQSSFSYRWGDIQKIRQEQKRESPWQKIK